MFHSMGKWQFTRAFYTIRAIGSVPIANGEKSTEIVISATQKGLLKSGLDIIEMAEQCGGILLTEEQQNFGIKDNFSICFAIMFKCEADISSFFEKIKTLNNRPYIGFT